jgi:hypothetical protein
VLGTAVPWIYLGYLAAFAVGLLVIGWQVSARWLKVD